MASAQLSLPSGPAPDTDAPEGVTELANYCQKWGFPAPVYAKYTSKKITTKDGHVTLFHTFVKLDGGFITREFSDFDWDNDDLWETTKRDVQNKAAVRLLQFLRVSFATLHIP
jgi:hypothetical protein